MNKYRQHSRADLTRNLRDNMRNVLDEIDNPTPTKESLADLDRRVMNVFNVTRKMFEVLQTSDLSADGKLAALQLLTVLNTRMGDKA